ncbi:MAG: hypothetical protein AB1750_15715 [Chloroflexota bacterium]
MRIRSFLSRIPRLASRAALGLLAASLTSCSLFATPTPDPNAQIRQSVAATIAALPSPTRAPTLPPRPTATPFSLSGLFCEYSFCIGHPNYLSFVDKKAIENAQVPSSYESGELTGYNENPLVVIYVIWLHAPGTTDSQFLLDTILADNLDTRAGDLKAQLIGGLNVYYLPIASIISPSLPYGAAASWVCGDRVFAWKVYTPDSAQPEALFQEAIGRFRCE